ncbi:hypothetical protein [Nannocystis punicea]|uniref:MYXO-CTERM domain-containing protein n=1 Tax=Nannocystis punicea TaxID=2995304 RepID=A0ABY7GYX8_9BACT|nr:hypothetical protein [Nannocystis poenicansa]WAS92203.1 hypothetical protein O0S08_38975 [Nannocystis poenicansa]
MNHRSRVRPRALGAATSVLCLAACPPSEGQALRGAPGVSVFSAEFALDEPVVAAAPGDAPALGFSGDQCLAVWRDFRTLRPQLRGARIGLDGELLDPSGFLVRDVADSYSVPSVASDGVDFMVVMPSVDGPIHATRVLADGTVPDLDGVLLATGGWLGALEFDGTDFLYAWTGAPGLHVARLSPSGQVLATGEEPVLADISPSSLDIAFDWQHHLVVWQREAGFGSRVVEAARLGLDGTLLDPVPITIDPFSGMAGPVVAFDGVQHVVVWGRNVEGDPEPDKLMAARVTSAGVVLDPGGLLIAEYDGEFDGFSRIDVIGNGLGATVAWSRDGSDDGGDFWLAVETARIGLDGAITRSAPLPGARGIDVALAGHGSDDALLAWSAGGSSPDENFAPIFGLRLSSSSGAAIEPSPRRISGHANAQEVRAAASDGDDFLVLWTDTRDLASQGRDLFATRVTPAGVVLDPAGIALPGHVDDVDVVFDGQNYWIIGLQYFNDSDQQSRAVRLRPDGTILDPKPLPLPMCEAFPAAARGDAGVLLLGPSCEYDPQVGYHEFAAILLDGAGALSSVHWLSEGPDDSMIREPALASHGDGFLAAWIFHDTIFGQRLGPTGAPLGPRFVVVPASPGVAVSDLSLQFGADEYLVLWQDTLGLHATFVALAGPAGASPVLSLAPPEVLTDGWGCSRFAGACPKAVFADDRFLVTWRAGAGGSMPASLDLAVAELDPSGALRGPVALSAAPESEGAAVLAVNDRGDVLATYSRFVADSAVSSRRAHARILASPPDLAAGASSSGGEAPSTSDELTTSATSDPTSSGELPTTGGSDGTAVPTSGPSEPVPDDLETTAAGAPSGAETSAGEPQQFASSGCSLRRDSRPPWLLALLAPLARRRRRAST